MVIGIGQNAHVPQLLPEFLKRTCDTVAKRPFISTHLMLPYNTERQPSHNLLYTVDLIQLL